MRVEKTEKPCLGKNRKLRVFEDHRKKFKNVWFLNYVLWGKTEKTVLGKR